LACPARTPKRGGAGLRQSPGGGRCEPPAGPDGLRAGWRRATAAGGPGQGGSAVWAKLGRGTEATAAERKNQGSKNELPDVGPRRGDGLLVEAMQVMLEELRDLNQTSVAGPNGSE
jgi:hypothetical protein